MGKERCTRSAGVATASRPSRCRGCWWTGLGTRPPGCKKLVGHKDLWRIRIGQYRVVYYIADTIKLVRVERVSHRKEAYR